MLAYIHGKTKCNKIMFALYTNSNEKKQQEKFRYLCNGKKKL